MDFESPGQPSSADPGLPENGSGIEVIEVGSVDGLLSPAEEQAAVLHANDRSQEALALLQTEIGQIRGLRRPETWWMLFELLQQQDEQAAHEKLGIEYQVEFGTAPPAWQEARNLPQAAHVCRFASLLDAASLEKDLAPLRSTETPAAVLLDFSLVSEIDSLAAAEILSLWQQLENAGTSCLVAGSTSLAGLLSKQIETGRRSHAEVPFWLLLLQVFQASDQQEAFESLAVDYAVTYEVSPPSWQPRTGLPPSAIPSGGALPLQGDITCQQPGTLERIGEYARQQAQDTAVIDFSSVNRIDFESAGQMLNLLIGLIQDGLGIRLVQVNALLFALLQLVGITQLVPVERRETTPPCTN